MRLESSLSLYQCTQLPICTVATVQLLYAIGVLTVTISVHTYQYVRWPQYSYCMWFESSLSLYQCTLLPICTVATVQLLYVIRILAVTISVHTVTSMYGSHSSYCMLFESSLSLYQCTLLPICTVATVVIVCYSNPRCRYTSAHCYQYVR